MIIQCPECGKKYKIDPEKIPEKGAKITCPNCQHSFLVRKKKEKEEPKPEIKTPPCQICGNPSTRVLKGDPPMLLCEACFVREMEKRRRFEVHPPSFTEAEPETMPPPPSEEEEEETTEKIPSEREEEEYFDSFAEIPDLGEYEKEIPPQPEIPQPPEEEFTPPEPEQPIFEETEFEEEEFEEPEKEPAPPPEPEIPSPEPPPPEEPSAPEQDFVFSPQEVESLEDTAPSEEKPPPIKEPAESKIPEVQEEVLEKELFKEVAEQIPPKIAPGKPRRKKISLPISSRALVIAGIILFLLAGGYVLFSNEKIRSSLGGIVGLFQKKPEKPLPELSEEQKQIIKEHLLLAQDLYKLDTKDAYLKSLNEIRKVLKIDKNHPEAKKLELIVSALLTYRYPQRLLIYKLRSSLKKAEASFGLSPEVQLAKALLNLAENDYASAKILAQKALENAPENPLALWLSAHIQLAGINPDYPQAKSLLEKALEPEPNLVLARCDLGEIYLKTKEYQNAVSEYEKILEISPSHELAQEKLALAKTFSAKKPKPEEEEEKLLLVEKPKPEEETMPLKVEPGKTVGTTAQEASTQEPSIEIDLDQEIKNFWLEIISETRKPLSRVRATKPTTPAPAPAPTTPTPSQPPEEAPSHPPEEAP